MRDLEIANKASTAAEQFKYYDPDPTVESNKPFGYVTINGQTVLQSAGVD